eukprot:TRINITY_DN6946_c0_g1_i1.p1 TRINITY_DN6946_c0_g1~~TRINITY_DN6946_c0_g1_i1.p1  ORF type:complete len:576 (+),score=152.57 TRINITY_DN6946_c0_g1_i1:3-1730(+)
MCIRDRYQRRVHGKEKLGQINSSLKQEISKLEKQISSSHSSTEFHIFEQAIESINAYYTAHIQNIESTYSQELLISRQECSEYYSKFLSLKSELQEKDFLYESMLQRIGKLCVDAAGSAAESGSMQSLDLLDQLAISIAKSTERERDLEEDVSRLQRSLENVSESNTELSLQLCNLQMIIDDKQAEEEYLRMLINTQKEQVNVESDKLRNNINELQKKIVLSQQEYERQLLEWKNENSKLSNNNAQIIGKIKEFQNTNAELEISNKKLQEEIVGKDNALNELTIYQTNFLDLQKELYSKNQLIENIQKESENYSKLHQESQKREVKLEEDIQKFVEENKKLNEELDKKKLELTTFLNLEGELSNETNELRTQNNKLEDELSTLSIEVNELKKNKERLQSQLANTRLECDHFRSSNSKLMGQIEKLNSEKAAIEDENLKIQNLLTQNTIEIDKLNTHNTTINLDLKNASSKINESESTIKTLKQTIKELNVQIENISEKNRKLNEELNSFSSEGSNLSTQNVELLSQIEKLKNEKDLLLKERNSLNSSSDIRLTSCLLYTSPSPRDLSTSRMPSSA